MNVLLTWFWKPRRAEVLAGVRIVLALYGLLMLVTRADLMGNTARLAEHHFRPVGVAAVLSEPLPPTVIDTLIPIGIVLGTCFLLGLWFRVTGPAFAVLMLFLLCYRNSWSMIYHSENLFVLHLLIVGVSHAANAWSLDARRRGQPIGLERSDWRYGWPVTLTWWVTALAYALAGVAKVAGPAGWGWASGDVVRSHVAANLVRKAAFGEAGSPLGEALYPYVWLFTLVGVATLVLELGAPLFLLNRRLRFVWAASILGMHIGIDQIMGIHFDYQLTGAMFAIYVPWDRVADRMQAVAASAHALVTARPSATPTDGLRLGTGD